MKMLKRSGLKIGKFQLLISAVLALIIAVNLVVIILYLVQSVWNSDLLNEYVTKEQINLFLQYLNEKLQRFNTFVTENMLK